MLRSAPSKVSLPCHSERSAAERRICCGGGEKQIPRCARNDGLGDFHLHWWAEAHVMLQLGRSAACYVAICPAICWIWMTTNSAGFSGANPTTIFTIPRLMSFWVVVSLSHFTKYASCGVWPW